jgi:hypothetical protein
MRGAPVWSKIDPARHLSRASCLPNNLAGLQDLGGQLHVPGVGGCGMTDAPKLLLAHHLKTLRLPTFLREYEKLSRQCAAEGLDHVQFLGRLVELKMIDRERRMIERRIKAAKFPTVKSLDSFDFKAIPGLNKIQVLELAWCEWIERTRARHIAGVVERDALDKARQHFLGRGFLVVLHRSCPGCPSV